MDIGWKIILDFLLRDVDILKAKAVIDSEQGSFVLNATQPLSHSRYRAWSHLKTSDGTCAVERAKLQKALEDRDAIALRLLFRTLFHHMCSRVQVISQQDTKSQFSIQINWNSRIHRPNSLCITKKAPPLPASCALSLVVVLHSSFKKCVLDTVSHFPNLDHERALHNGGEENHEHNVSLNSMEFSPCSANILLTPTTVSSFGTPGFFDRDEPLVLCELCLETYPTSLTHTLMKCGHILCIACGTACVKKHHAAPYATPDNMPCPHLRCPSTLNRGDVRKLTNLEAYTNMEFNEVARILQQRAEQCPSCGFMFERINDSTLSYDPLKDKLICIACGVTFCAVCFTAPFHSGRPCRHGGDDGSAAPRCRYCGNIAVETDSLVCDALECQSKKQFCCTVKKSCGHLCYGTLGESTCVPCLEEDCDACHLNQCKDDFCVICFTDVLSDAPCLELECGHIFHRHCLERKIKQRWPTARINFCFLRCPLCDQEITHHLLSEVLSPVLKLRETLEARYVDRLRIEGLIDQPPLTDPSSPFYEKHVLYAASLFNYYLCSRCERPYFGGLRRCQDVDREEPDRADLICGGCSAGSAVCHNHGPGYLEWKCKYCCNTAVWYCWGTTHFCELCHTPPRKTVRQECEGEERCPLKALHPPNGVEFALGCALCRTGFQKMPSAQQKAIKN